MNKNALIDKLIDLVRPIVTNFNCELYHLEFVKEGNENYFRIYIEKEEVGVSLEDCEKVSRAVSDMLDIEDPISEGYYLEVSSPGIYRVLHTDEHFRKYTGYKVLVKLSGILNGKKKYEGELLDFTNEELKIKVEDTEIAIPRNKVSDVSLSGEL